MKDRPDGKVGLKYTFDPPINSDTPDTPAVQLGRKVIKTIQDVKDGGGWNPPDSRSRA